MKPLNRKVLWLLVPALFVGCIGSALAFLLSESHWENGQTIVFTGIPGESPNGETWADALRGAMDEWNASTYAFRFYSDPGYRDPCAGYNGYEGNGDLRNGAAFRSDICGIPFDDGALAVTLIRRIKLPPDYFIVDADMVFNSNSSWDIYDGPVRDNAWDFHRVALHELGHVLGLMHELTNEAIMNPVVSGLDHLTADDIAGVSVRYPRMAGGAECEVNMVKDNNWVGSLLSTADCPMRSFFGGNDNSHFERYMIEVPAGQRLSLHVTAEGFEPLLIVTSLDHDVIDVFESSGDCSARGTTAPLPSGSYFVLVNTYDEPRPCGTGEGWYKLSISDEPMPVLGPPRTFERTNPEGIRFQAGASLSGGQDYRSDFAATDYIDVNAKIQVTGYMLQLEVGRPVAIYMVAILDDGRSFMKDATGNFVPWSGELQDLQPTLKQPLSESVMDFEVVRGLRGDLTGLSGHTFQVFIGYSVIDSPYLPEEVYYSSSPLSFRIAPQ